MLVWPERTAPHHGASPLYGTTWVSIRHGSCEPTASGPGEPAESLGASKVTWVITQIGSPQTGKDNGQGLPMRRLTGVEVRLWNIPITVGEALTSPQAHTPSFMGAGKVFSILWCWWYREPPSRQWAAHAGHSWNGLSAPLLQTGVGWTHQDSQTLQCTGCLWSMSATFFPRNRNG